MQIKLTETGKDLLLESLTGAFGITFSSIVIGNGDGSAATDSISALVNPLRTLSIKEYELHDNFVEISSDLTNAGVENQINLTEIGVMALDPTLDDEPVLFAYLYTPEDSAIIIPAASDYVLETVLKVDVYVSSAENISAVISESLSYPTKAEFQDHVNDHSNPHQVTKEQVGLGNVPNVSTNNQTPTFSIASALAEINSGENISTIMGKIKKAISSLISHIGNKSNPHSVTLSQVGAAAASHKHTASDINAGTLGVTRGGTGISSISEGRLLYSDKANSIAALPRSNNDGRVLRQDSQNAPYFGQMIEMGQYEGNNRSGSGNKNAILFTQIDPKFIVIIGSSSADRSNGFLVKNGSGFAGWSSYGGTLTGSSTKDLNSWVTVEWYDPTGSASPASQLNAPYRYFYLGIG